MTIDAISDRLASARAGARDGADETRPQDASRDDVSTRRSGTSGATVTEAVVSDATDDLARVALVASVEPSVVFSSLAAQCVPEMCDGCTIDIVDGPRAGYRIANPPRHTPAGGLLRLVDCAGTAPEHRVQVSFAHPRSVHAWPDKPQDERQSAGHDEFHGVATFVWHHHTPTRAERGMAAVLIDHAVHTVAWQRSEHAASAATEHAAKLELALQSSRHIGAAIGILMSLHKITQDQGFDLLRTASQHSNRKLRDLALDVIDTGWLDPALLRGSPRLNPSSAEHDPSETLSDRG